VGSQKYPAYWVFRLIVTGDSGIVTVQSGDRDRRFRQS